MLSSVGCGSEFGLDTVGGNQKLWLAGFRNRSVLRWCGFVYGSLDLVMESSRRVGGGW